MSASASQWKRSKGFADGIETLGKAEPCLTEAIANPATSPTMDSTPLDADEQMSTDNDAIIEDPEAYIARTKSLDDFYEELIISRAPPEVRDENKPRASASPDEIAAYRGRVFNHKKTRHRFVFQVWPRDPKGDCIRPGEGKPGKMTPNNQQIWGATLLDFYTVNRLPSAPGYVTYSSGSRLARWMKEHGETEAQDMIERQEDELEAKLIALQGAKTAQEQDHKALSDIQQDNKSLKVSRLGSHRMQHP